MRRLNRVNRVNRANRATLVTLAAVALALALLVAAPAQAQVGRGTLACLSESAALACSSVERAAQPLLARGARVATYLVASGDEGGQDVLRLLARDGLASGTRVDPDLLLVYVSLSPRYAELRAGDRWSAVLPDNELTRIRTEVLTPALRSGDYAAGLAATLAEMNRALEAASDPATPAAPAGGVRLLALGIAAATGLAGGGYALYAWRRRRQALGDARWYADDQRRQADEALLESDRQLRNERDLAAHDASLYGPAHAANLSGLREAAAQKFEQAQIQFSDVIERRSTAGDDRAALERVAAELRSIIAQCDMVKTQLGAIAELRQQLDRLGEQAAARLAELRATLDASAQALGAHAALGLDTSSALSALRSQASEADRQLAAHQAAGAITLADRIAADAQALCTAAGEAGGVAAQLQQARRELPVLQALGYDPARSVAAIEQGQQALAGLAAALNQGQLDPGALEAGRAAAERAGASGRGMLAQRAENERRLFELGARAAEVALLIEQARSDFDMVDEFAESSWSDIRGNGSEAEAAAARAGALWEQARSANAIERQAFDAAAAQLAEAGGELERAATLAQAISARLRDLEHARAIARDELAAATADLAGGQAYLASNDADVGDAPQAQLQHAADLLAQAQREAASERPDWLALVRLAQQANAAADAALAGARSEVEVMDSLRRQVANAEQVARGEVERAQRYFEAHRSDISWDSTGTLGTLRERLAAGLAAQRRAAEQAEGERRVTFQAALQSFTSADKGADGLFATMYAEVARAEQARYAEEQERQHSSNSSGGLSWSSSSGSGHSSSSSSWGSGGSSGGSSWGSGGSSGGSSWGSGSKSGGGW
jgi:hypothetical protein